jgi:hypothetical protein
MPNWGPFTVVNGPGTVTPDGRDAVVWDTGQVAIGSITQVTGTETVTFTGGRSDAAYDVHIEAFDPNNQQIEFRYLVQLRLTTSVSSWTYTPPVVASRLRVTFSCALYQGQTMTCTAQGTYLTRAACEHGTQLQQGASFVYYLTPGLLDVWLAEVGLPWLAPLFTGLWFSTLNAQTLCGQGPPPMPVINLSTLSQGADTALQVLRVIAWANVCECSPGTPSPVPYPPPAVSQPTGWPTFPTGNCDPANICAVLLQLQEQLAAVAGAVGSQGQLINLLQRYQLPFAYVPGAVHQGLTGEGGFSVSRLLGLLLEVVSVPPGVRSMFGNPDYLMDLGWLSISDRSGFLDEKRLTRSSVVWLPVRMAEATSFTWALSTGVTVRATELQAET